MIENWLTCSTARSRWKPGTWIDVSSFDDNRLHPDPHQQNHPSDGAFMAITSSSLTSLPGGRERPGDQPARRRLRQARVRKGNQRQGGEQHQQGVGPRP